nr:DUF1289 domain-containing protein [Colwellia echini]
MSKPVKIKLSDTPCVRNCCLDEADICLGCFRHLDEILAWRDCSSAEKQNIMKKCQQRSSDRKSEI